MLHFSTALDRVSGKVLICDFISEFFFFSGKSFIVSTGFFEKFICVYFSVQAKNWKLPFFKKINEIEYISPLSSFNQLQGNKIHNMAHWKYTGKVKAEQK